MTEFFLDANANFRNEPLVHEIDTLLSNFAEALLVDLEERTKPYMPYYKAFACIDPTYDLQTMERDDYAAFCDNVLNWRGLHFGHASGHNPQMPSHRHSVFPQNPPTKLQESPLALARSGTTG